MVMAIHTPISPPSKCLLKKYANPILKLHMEAIAMSIVQTTSPAARRVLGNVKEGTQKITASTVCHRITCTARLSVWGVSW